MCMCWILQVPALFTENFDYQFFYPDFVNGILTSDLLGKTICCSIIGEESVLNDKKPVHGGRKSADWAAAVGNTRSFDSIRFVGLFHSTTSADALSSYQF